MLLTYRPHARVSRPCLFVPTPDWSTFWNAWETQNNTTYQNRTHACTTSIKVRLLQSLDHPNIIRYLDFFLEESDGEQNQLVIAFEW